MLTLPCQHLPPPPTPQPDSRWNKYSNPWQLTPLPPCPEIQCWPGRGVTPLGLVGFDFFLPLAESLVSGPTLHLGGRRGAMKYVRGSNISSTYGSRCGALGVVFWRTRAGWLRTLGVPRVPAYRVCMHSMGSGGAARDRHAGQSDGRVLRPRLTDCLRCWRNAVGTSWWRSLVQSPLHSTHRRRFWRCWRR